MGYLRMYSRGIKDVISVKWIYKTKQDVYGNVQTHKERMVVGGFTKQPSIDFNEIFAPVARMDTVRIVLAIIAQKNGLFIERMSSQHS